MTGGGSGIGRAIAVALADTGRPVTAVGRDGGRLESLEADRPGVLTLTCDVGDQPAVERVVAEAAEKHGPVEVLINCAGMVSTAPFEKTNSDTWEMLWRTNVMGAVHTCQAVVPAMRGFASARIVNIASTASLKGYPYVSAYTATKHALLGLTRALAVEFANTAITVNAICPGYADTDIIRDAVAKIMSKTGRDETEARAAFTSANPQGRLIEPEEVAATVLWLVSDAARSITGQAIVVAGGEIM